MTEHCFLQEEKFYSFCGVQRNSGQDVWFILVSIYNWKLCVWVTLLLTWFLGLNPYFSKRRERRWTLEVQCQVHDRALSPLCWPASEPFPCSTELKRRQPVTLCSLANEWPSPLFRIIKMVFAVHSSGFREYKPVIRLNNYTQSFLPTPLLYRLSFHEWRVEALTLQGLAVNVCCKYMLLWTYSLKVCTNKRGLWVSTPLAPAILGGFPPHLSPVLQHPWSPEGGVIQRSEKSDGKCESVRPKTERINYFIWDASTLTTYPVTVCTDFDCRQYYFITVPSLPSRNHSACHLVQPSNMWMKERARRYLNKKIVILQNVSLFIIDKPM